MGKGDVCPFFSNCQLTTSIRKEKETVDKMIAHFVTAPLKRYLGEEHFHVVFYIGDAADAEGFY